eukprot:TRINITY_DN3555_c1_g1_i1.p1 TRINITY_DN3555_c1_g1~~TRINITY_DN3555_c1_g1_i1.p1  ORF type:complete len:1061 (+),score=289.69 TRINITY_DN3555_c1_g1_i1:461-3184(+)
MAVLHCQLDEADARKALLTDESRTFATTVLNHIPGVTSALLSSERRKADVKVAKVVAQCDQDRAKWVDEAVRSKREFASTLLTREKLEREQLAKITTGERDSYIEWRCAAEKRWREQLRRLEEEFANTQKTTTATNDTAKLQTANMRASMEELGAMQQRWQSEIALLTSELTLSKQRVVTLTDECDKLRVFHHRVEKDKSSQLTKALDDATTETAALRSERDTLKQRVFQSESKEREVEAQHSALARRLSFEEAQRTGAEEEARSLQVDIRAAREAQRAAQHTCDEKAAENRRLHDEVTALKAQVAAADEAKCKAAREHDDVAHAMKLAHGRAIDALKQEVEQGAAQYQALVQKHAADVEEVRRRAGEKEESLKAELEVEMQRHRLTMSRLVKEKEASFRQSPLLLTRDEPDTTASSTTQAARPPLCAMTATRPVLPASAESSSPPAAKAPPAEMVDTAAGAASDVNTGSETSPAAAPAAEPTPTTDDIAAVKKLTFSPSTLARSTATGDISGQRDTRAHVKPPATRERRVVVNDAPIVEPVALEAVRVAVDEPAPIPHTGPAPVSPAVADMQTPRQQPEEAVDETPKKSSFFKSLRKKLGSGKKTATKEAEVPQEHASPAAPPVANPMAAPSPAPAGPVLLQGKLAAKQRERDTKEAKQRKVLEGKEGKDWKALEKLWEKKMPKAAKRPPPSAQISLPALTSPPQHAAAPPVPVPQRSTSPAEGRGQNTPAGSPTHDAGSVGMDSIVAYAGDGRANDDSDLVMYPRGDNDSMGTGACYRRSSFSSIDTLSVDNALLAPGGRNSPTSVCGSSPLKSPGTKTVCIAEPPAVKAPRALEPKDSDVLTFATSSDSDSQSLSSSTSEHPAQGKGALAAMLQSKPDGPPPLPPAPVSAAKSQKHEFDDTDSE